MQLTYPMFRKIEVSSIILINSVPNIVLTYHHHSMLHWISWIKWIKWLKVELTQEQELEQIPDRPSKFFLDS